MMKKGLMIVMCLFAVLVSSAAEPLAAEWRAVDEALGKKHSRSAIGMLEKVEVKALELKRWPDYTAARLRRLALDYDLADETAADLHDPKGVVAKFAGEIAAAPVVVRPMLRLALMHYYAELAAEERRYEGLRTKIVGEVTTNLPPWSAEQLRRAVTCRRTYGYDDHDDEAADGRADCAPVCTRGRPTGLPCESDEP